jgi:glycosyltransferase 2 family protein
MSRNAEGRAHDASTADPVAEAVAGSPVSAPGRRAILRVAILAIIVVAMVLFARSVQWGEVWKAVRGTSPTLLGAAAVVNLLSIALKGVRWWVFLRPIGVPSLPLAIRGTFVGAGLNNLLVANGGEAARVLYVARSAGAPASAVLATLAMERLFELMGWAFTLSLAVTLLPLPESLNIARPAALAMLVGMAAFLVYLLRHPGQPSLPVIAGDGMLHRARRFGRDFMQAMRAISSGPRFVAALLVSMMVWAMQIATYHLTAIAAGLPLPLVGTIAAMLAVNIGFAVRATPGNVGVFQMVYAVTAAGFAVDKDLATGTAFVLQAQQLLPVTLLGLAFAPRLLFDGRREPPPRAATRRTG